MNPIKIGEDAPDFTLKDQYGEEFKLSDFEGKKILLSFHPLAWTGVCAKQMEDLEKNHNKFEELNTVAVGISIDSVPSKLAWSESLHLDKTRILADFWPHGKVAELYGVFREKDGFSERVNIIIDENQKIIFVKIYEISQVPDLNEIFEVLKK